MIKNTRNRSVSGLAYSLRTSPVVDFMGHPIEQADANGCAQGDEIHLEDEDRSKNPAGKCGDTRQWGHTDDVMDGRK
jgi:hypothetical protein